MTYFVFLAFIPPLTLAVRRVKTSLERGCKQVLCQWRMSLHRDYRNVGEQVRERVESRTRACSVAGRCQRYDRLYIMTFCGTTLGMLWECSGTVLGMSNIPCCIGVEWRGVKRFILESIISNFMPHPIPFLLNKIWLHQMTYPITDFYIVQWSMWSFLLDISHLVCLKYGPDCRDCLTNCYPPFIFTHSPHFLPQQSTDQPQKTFLNSAHCWHNKLPYKQSQCVPLKSTRLFKSRDQWRMGISVIDYDHVTWVKWCSR